MLVEDPDKSIQIKNTKASDTKKLQAHCSTDTVVFSWRKGSVGCRREGMDWRADTQLVLDLSSISNHTVQMVTSMKLGQERTPDPEQPGVIIRRKGHNERLWDLAKRCGSTVSAIERINALDSVPEDDQLLLIPVL